MVDSEVSSGAVRWGWVRSAPAGHEAGMEEHREQVLAPRLRCWEDTYDGPAVAENLHACCTLLATVPRGFCSQTASIKPPGVYSFRPLAFLRPDASPRAARGALTRVGAS